MARLEELGFNLKIINIFMGILNAVFSCFVIATMLHIMSPYHPYKYDGNQYDSLYEPIFVALYSVSIVLVLLFLAKFILELAFLYAVVAIRPKIVKVFSVVAVVNFLVSTLIVCLHVPVKNSGIVCFQHLYMIFLIYSIILSDSYYKHISQHKPQRPSGLDVVGMDTK